MTKGGNLKENELEILEAMKNSLSPGKDGHMDEKYDALIKQKESNAMEVENLKRVIDDLKRYHNEEKDSHRQVLDRMSNSFESVQQTLMQEKMEDVEKEDIT